MEFILPFKVAPSAFKISYSHKIIFIGSCFSDEIGKQMKKAKFTVLQNPNGILYDPASISSSINSYIKKQIYKKEDLFLLHDVWHSWHHHSAFSGMDGAKVLENINESQLHAHHFLKEAEWLIMTPGTSYNYHLKESGEAVASCHKVPSSYFEKKLMSIQEITDKFSDTILKLQLFNPDLKIIFTVSPVRHIRDGVIENNRSKARLIEAIHSIKDTFKNVFYYPAYELIIDVLRDYRFYKMDLVHPSEIATSFVFENFCTAFVDENSLKILEEIKGINSAIHHKPFRSESAEYKGFKSVQLEKIKYIKSKYSFLDFSNEEIFFS